MALINPSQNPFLTPEESQAAKSAIPPFPAPSEVSTPVPVPIQSPVVSKSVAAVKTFPPLFDEQPKKRAWLWRSLVLLIAIALIGGGIFFWLRQRPTSQVPVAVTSLTTSTSTTSSQPTPKASITQEGNALYQSEHFKAGEIALGGEAVFLSSVEDVAPLEISNIRGEAFTEKTKQVVKLVVTWGTNKLSLADITYAKGIGQTEKTISESDYSFNHSMIITGLDPASTYLYTIKSKDRFGGIATSDPHAVFTGARSVSLFDLIAGAIGDVFGWAVSK